LILLVALGAHETSRRDIKVATLREVGGGVLRSAIILAVTKSEQRFMPDLPSGIVVVVDQGQAVPKRSRD
jgi:hypothetical protein